MLVLSRKVSERIFITAPDGTVLTLMLVEVRGNNVRIGIDAPREWLIMREGLEKK